MKSLVSLSLVFICSFSLSAQLSDGAIAPDFTVEDINGVTHNLYDYLDAGKSVVLDFSATWCPPCWSYHNSGILEDLYSDFGPGGTDEIMVFMVEADNDTSQDCIYDAPTCSGGSLGDWTVGVDYPILNPPAAQANSLASDYSISFWPTMYGVAPNGNIYLIGQESYDEWASYLVGSFLISNSTYEVFDDGCSASIDLTPIGTDLSFNWSNGETTEDIFELGMGEYTLTITDDNNFETIIGPIDVTGGQGNEVVFSEVENVLCSGEFDGSIIIDVEGGSGDYDYEWSNGDSTSEIYNLPSGDYWITVTDTDNGCTSEDYFYIEEPELLEVVFELSDATCGELGEVEIEVEGGTGFYSYQFEDFTTNFNEVDLEQGTYDVTVSDFNECEIYGSFVIEGTEAPVSVASSSGSINCFNSTSILSSDGSATGSNIIYTWYNTDGTPISTDPSIIVSEGGDYVLEVYDNDTSCSSNDNLFVAMNNNMPLSVSNYSNAVDCINSTATILGAGSSESGVTYAWSTADGVISSAANQINATVASGGTYTLVVSDPDNGCISTSSVIVPFNGDMPTANITPPTSLCQGTTVQVCLDTEPGNDVSWYIDGIVFPSTGLCIVISSSSVVEATVTNAMSGCTSSASTSISVTESPVVNIAGDNLICQGNSTNLCVTLDPTDSVNWINDSGQNLGTTTCITVSQTGTYLAEVNNANGCASIAEMIVSTIDNPTAIITGDQNICEGSTGILCADAGGQSFQWIFEGSVISTSQCIDVNMAGLYSLNTNNGYCTNASSTTVVIEAIPSIDVQSSGLLDCNNQSVVVTAMTNVGTDITWSDVQGNVVATGASYSTNLAGEYYASTTSAIGCQSITSITVDQDNTALPTAGYQFTSLSDTYTFQSQVQGTVTGYLWDFGDGNTSNEENPTHVYADTGSYNVCLTVTNDCGSNSDCQSVSLQGVLSVSASAIDVTCYGGNDGTINVSISGGSAPYTISTTPDVGNSEVLKDLLAGDYNILITDNDGLEMAQMTTVNEPTEISNNVLLINATQGNNDGSISLTTFGGVPDFMYLWSNGSTESGLTGLSVGEYAVEITDANGCLLFEEYSIMEQTSSNQIDFIQSFVASPNPAIDQINIVLEMDQQAEIAIELINSLGEVVYRADINSALSSHTMDVSEFPSGIYFVNLKHQNQSMTKKIMVLD